MNSTVAIPMFCSVYVGMAEAAVEKVRAVAAAKGDDGVNAFAIGEMLTRLTNAQIAEAIPALSSGKLVNRETIVDGLHSAPAALLDLLHSGAGNIGKMVVKLSD
jgi:NADPH-dependent curcumin reductase CurA